jgi:heme exporter protein D
LSNQLVGVSGTALASRLIGIKRDAKVSHVLKRFYQIGAFGMFVTLSLIVSLAAPVVVVLAPLRRAPEAYENEQGLQIIQKRSAQVKRVALGKKLCRSLLRRLRGGECRNVRGRQSVRIVFN